MPPTQPPISAKLVANDVSPADEGACLPRPLGVGGGGGLALVVGVVERRVEDVTGRTSVLDDWW